MQENGIDNRLEKLGSELLSQLTINILNKDYTDMFYNCLYASHNFIISIFGLKFLSGITQQTRIPLASRTSSAQWAQTLH